MSHVVHVASNEGHVGHWIMEIAFSVVHSIDKRSFIHGPVFIVNCYIFNLRFKICSVANLWIVLKFPGMEIESFRPFYKEFQIVFFQTVLKHLCQELWFLILCCFLNPVIKLFSRGLFYSNRNLRSLMRNFFFFNFFKILLIRRSWFLRAHNVPILIIYLLLVFLFDCILLNFNQNFTFENFSVEGDFNQHCFKIRSNLRSYESVDVI